MNVKSFIKILQIKQYNCQKPLTVSKYATKYKKVIGN